MDTITKTYNTRSKTMNCEDKDMTVKSGNSDDDSSYMSDSDSDWEEHDDISSMDRHEYRKFLSKIFPSNHLNKTVSAGEKMKQMCKKNMDDTVNTLIPRKKTKKESEKEEVVSEDDEEVDTDEEEDSESDEDDEETAMFGGEKGMFNIVFTVKGNNIEEDKYSEDEEESEDEVEEDSEEEDEPIEKDEKKEKNNNTVVCKKTKKSKEKNDVFDETSTKAFRELMNIFKTKKSDSCKEAFHKMEKYLENEEEKIKKATQKKEMKQKLKNLKKFRKTLRSNNVMSEYKFFKTLDLKHQLEILQKAEEITKFDSVDTPYRIKLIESPIPCKYKASAMRKISALETMDPGSGEYFKVKQWVDTFMRIPFGIYKSLPVNIDDGIDKCNQYMANSLDTLNNAVYGMDDAKMQIMQMMGNWISKPDAVGSAIAIKGPMGTGKTTLVKEGVSKILNRPFAFIALGGATDSSSLEGHSYTYEGSVWGKIVDIIIQSKCMNPVIYFDELDKVSDTAKGEEIIGILTHLTDTSQNSQFHDKYFSNIDFDLSKVLFIFSYNDESKVNPILKDRMYCIETKGYKEKEKTIIANKYLIPSIEKNINFNNGDITISTDTLKYIIKEYTQEEHGVRNLKRCLEILYTKLNLYRLMKPDTKLFNDVETFKVEFPFTITNDIVKKLIKKNKQDQWYRSMYV